MTVSAAAVSADRNYASMTAAEMIEGWDEIVRDVRRDVDAGNRAGLVAFGKLAADLLSHDHDRNFYALVVEYLRAAVETLGQSPEPVNPAPAPVAAPTMPHPGYYTVVLDGDDDYVTIEIESDFRADAPADSVTVKFLNGPDNTTNYTGFAFANPRDGIKVWKRYQGTVSRPVRAAGILFGDPATAEDAALAYAMESGRCARCHRTLTVPASLHRGYGPDCAAMLGI